ncbi:MAG: S-methyl-5'-thioadenosine phosphorylase [Rhodobacteraceae bacterium]|nr:S-methyl-5'-thioadenosine phosphorylase [Paracoccaceae bacterium]
MADTFLGIIGGSGLYEIDSLEKPEWISVDTPWGAPSDQILTGSLDGCPVAFLPRHGRGHVHSPTSIPYRANIDALKRLGATDIVSVSACGSLREDMAPGHFVFVDQFIDRTFARDKSYFGTGCVAHVSMARPTCRRLSSACLRIARDLGITSHEQGTYLAMEGPQFSTLAESNMYRKTLDCDVIGMTNMPEAKLAREAELCYATIAMVTDYDSWHPEHGEVDVTEIIRTLTGNTAKAKELVERLPSTIGGARQRCSQGCDRSLDSAILSAGAAESKLAAKLDAVAGRVLGQ